MEPYETGDADSLSASSTGFGRLTDSVKRRCIAQDFDNEQEKLEMEASKPKLSRQQDQEIRERWNSLVTSSAKSIMDRTCALPWEIGVAGMVLNPGQNSDLRGVFKLGSVPLRFLHDKDPEDLAKSERAVIISRLESIPGAWKLAAQRLSSLQLRADDSW